MPSSKKSKKAGRSLVRENSVETNGLERMPGWRKTLRRIAAGAAMLWLALGGIHVLLAGQKITEKDLSPRYRDWLKLVSYILLPAEQDVFMRLTTDRDRDIFLEAFWRQRDPTPTTPQNEFRDEHLKRFQYANSHLNRGTPREGWMTDMGRMHIILGAPTSIERFDSAYGIQPCQVWYYFGDKAKGLPGYFGLVFFQRGGGGEYKLYNPASDGPISLLVDNRGIDLTNPAEAYAKIKNVAPSLAAVSISIIPGEVPYGYNPSPRNSIILSQIIESPKKDVSPSYATHFLNYKGVVSTEYLINFVESSASVALIHDPSLGLDFLHFSISPVKISIDYFEPKDQYYCNFKLNVSLRRKDAVIFQYSKDYPFYFPPDKLEAIQANGISVLDFFPIAEGGFELTILLQNAVGKEFSIFEKKVEIPGEGSSPKMMGPVLGYKLQDDAAANSAPFKIGSRQLQADPKNAFGSKDEVAFFINLLDLSRELWSEGTIDVRVVGAKSPDKPAKSFSLKLAETPFRRSLGVFHAFPAGELAPDYYDLKLELKNGRGGVETTASAPLVISPAEAVPHPVTLIRTLPEANNFLYYYGLAGQYDKTGAYAKSGALFQKAYEMKPDHAEGIVDYADFLIKTGKFDEALRLSEALKNNDKFRFDHFLVRGRAQMGKGEFGSAVESLLEGNKIYNSDTRLLNALGSCYYRTGRKKEALDVLAASLRLNPEQKDIKELAAKIEKELK